MCFFWVFLFFFLNPGSLTGEKGSSIHTKLLLKGGGQDTCEHLDGSCWTGQVSISVLVLA